MAWAAWFLSHDHFFTVYHIHHWSMHSIKKIWQDFPTIGQNGFLIGDFEHFLWISFHNDDDNVAIICRTWNIEYIQNCTDGKSILVWMRKSCRKQINLKFSPPSLYLIWSQQPVIEEEFKSNAKFNRWENYIGRFWEIHSRLVFILWRIWNNMKVLRAV